VVLPLQFSSDNKSERRTDRQTDILTRTGNRQP